MALAVTSSMLWNGRLLAEPTVTLRPARQEGGGVPGIEVLISHAAREGQLVGRVLPDREEQAAALLEDLELGSLLPHPLIGIVGLAEIGAELELAEGGSEPLLLRDGPGRYHQERQCRGEDKHQPAATLFHMALLLPVGASSHSKPALTSKSEAWKQ